jgi:hypothetical protein
VQRAAVIDFSGNVIVHNSRHSAIDRAHTRYQTGDEAGTEPATGEYILSIQGR